MPKIIITEDSIKIVLKIIDTWKGKLTWSLLCEEVSNSLSIGKVERQSLAAYSAIQQSYSDRKISLKDDKGKQPVASKNVTVEYLAKQVESLQYEVAQLKKINEKYKQRFILWQYNAYLNGIRVNRLDDVADVLNEPLTAVNRAKGG